jgi:hypothetical protein
MLILTFLGRLVVVGNDGKLGGGAVLLRRLGELDRLGGRVRAGAGDDRNAAARVLDRDADQLLVLVEIDRGRFTGGADHDDAVGPLGDVPVDQLAEARQIEPAVLQHGCDDRDQAASNHGGDSTS